MGKLIAAINMTLDGFCDHTAILPDDEIHRHYADLLRTADTVLYGRVTFGLMEYWRMVVAHPTGNPATDEFALIMDAVPKVVFSHTLKNSDWASARLAARTLEEEVLELKHQPDKVSMVGSRSLMIQLMKLNWIDEYQFCVHPVVAGGGMPLFEYIHNRTMLRFIRTKTFTGGAVVLYYEPMREG